MAIFNLFSKRQQALRTDHSDVLTYDNLPETLRVQIVHIITDGLGEQNDRGYNRHEVEEAYKEIHDILCREYGTFTLNDEYRYSSKLTNFILTEKDIERVLDAVELTLSLIVTLSGMHGYTFYVKQKIDGQNAIVELNERFRQHAVGYSYESDRIIKIDSTYTHSEIVKPTLQLLFNPKFIGANEEYLKAHEHYRHGRNKECLSECLKAFESTMKIICIEKGWSINASDTSRALLNVIMTNNLIPTFIQGQLTSLRSLLESGIPTIRNRLGGAWSGSFTNSC